MFRRDIFKNIIGASLLSTINSPAKVELSSLEPARLMRYVAPNIPYSEVFFKTLPELVIDKRDKPLINTFGVSIYMDPCGIFKSEHSEHAEL
jgi:hypothetical protein